MKKFVHLLELASGLLTSIAKIANVVVEIAKIISRHCFLTAARKGGVWHIEYLYEANFNALHTTTVSRPENQ